MLPSPFLDWLVACPNPARRHSTRRMAGLSGEGLALPHGRVVAFASNAFLQPGAGAAARPGQPGWAPSCTLLFLLLRSFFLSSFLLLSYLSRSPVLSSVLPQSIHSRSTVVQDRSLKPLVRHFLFPLFSLLVSLFCSLFFFSPVLSLPYPFICFFYPSLSRCSSVAHTALSTLTTPVKRPRAAQLKIPTKTICVSGRPPPPRPPCPPVAGSIPSCQHTDAHKTTPRRAK